MTSAVITCGALLLLAALQWTIIDHITPFLFFPLLALVGLLFLCSTLFSVFMWFRQRRQGLSTARAFGLHMLTLLALLLVPFTNIELWVNFHTKQTDREAVVREIESGKLKPNVAHNPSLVALGDGRKLSAGGNDVIVATTQGRTYVLFYTYRGLLNNYAGFLYVPEGGKPEEFERIGERTTQLIRFADRWYFTSGH